MLIRADARRLPLADGCVQCCVTSPPYFGLRDYGVSGQIGHEPTPDAYVAQLVTVFREVRRVLADDGVLWLNLGDSYVSNGRYESDRSEYVGDLSKYDHRDPRVGAREIGLKPKDLIGIPWRVAFALQADGWYLRSDIIWHKPNPMPESVTDRPTKSHEYLFLLTKSERYYYDAAAIAEAIAPSQVGRVRDDVFGGAAWEGRQQHSEGGRYKTGGNFSRTYAEQQPGHGGMALERPEYATRNRRSVWTIPTAPYPGAHFATFPEALVEPCVLAGSRYGDLVLDPFGGTATVVRVARRLGRRGVACELNPAYLALARERIVTTGGLPLEATT